MMGAMVWCGLDPGLSGACAFIGPDGLGAAVYPMPLMCVDGQDELDSGALRELLEAHNPSVVAIEKVQGFGGPSGAFKLGQNYGGMIVTALAGRFRMERARPQTWQRLMLPGVHGRDALKAASVARAKAEFPTISFKKSGRTSDHDIADALLIAAWARAQFP
jgi:Holliday junction resolvasome RuvABC endonuclease subunit